MVETEKGRGKKWLSLLCLKPIPLGSTGCRQFFRSLSLPSAFCAAMPGYLCLCVCVSMMWCVLGCWSIGGNITDPVIMITPDTWHCGGGMVGRQGLMQDWWGWNTFSPPSPHPSPPSIFCTLYRFASELRRGVCVQLQNGHGAMSITDREGKESRFHRVT